MLYLHTLTFNNIRCFDSQQTINFYGRDKLIQIDGRNENTGGSSGAGKTTVFLALDYLLGISDIPATMLQSRLTDAPIEVVGEFMITGMIPVKITRSKKTGLTLQIGDETISGNVKLAEEKLDEIIGIPRKIFKKMIHKKQKEGGFFLEMTSKEIYEFLISILDLDSMMVRVDGIGGAIKQYAQQIQEVSIAKQLAQSTKSDLSRIIGEKQKPNIDFSEQDLTEQKNLLIKVETDLKIITDKVSIEINSINKPEKQLVDFNSSKLNNLQQELSQIEEKLNKIKVAGNDLISKIVRAESSKEQAVMIGREIVGLSNRKKQIQHEATCPTCNREWSGEAAQLEINKIDVEIHDKTQQILALKTEIDTIADYKTQQSHLQDINKEMSTQRDILSNSLNEEKAVQKNFQNTQDTQYKIQIAEYNHKVMEIKNKYSVEISNLTDTKQTQAIKIAQMQSQFDAYKFAISTYNNELTTLAQRIQEKEEELKNLEVQDKELQKITLIAQESQRLIKTYTLQTFQETLDLIGDMATNILSGIPNMANSTIYFEGCKENKDGSLKNEVTAIINVNGENKIPIKSLSGGEKTAIDLAVDLAVIDIIETKIGKGADFFVIDEPFDGLDSVCKENCLEILKQVDTSKKIIMVDHSSELKEMISDVITVVKNGENSTVIS